jgi:hypothetical protein
MVDSELPCPRGRVQTKLVAARDEADSRAIGEERVAIQRRVWRVIRGCGNEESIIKAR